MMKDDGLFRAGETLLITVSATDRFTKMPVSDAVCTVDLFAPPKNPEANPNDRTVDHSIIGAYDSGSKMYLIYVDTSGWTPGRWVYRATLSGPYISFDYEEFTLQA